MSMQHFLWIFGIATLVVVVLAVRSVLREVRAAKRATEDLGSKADDDDVLNEIEEWREGR